MGRRPRRWPFRAAVSGVAAVAVAAAAFGAWQVWGADWQADRRATAASAQFRSSCSLDPGFSGGPDTAADGSVVADLTLPGTSTPWPVRVGVQDASLADGVGWYRQTAAPGEVGNMAVVGYRLGAGGAFDGILSLNTGDTIRLETCFRRYTYTIEVAPRDLTVQPTDTWVLQAVPGQPAAMPTDSWLTLIANQDISPSTDRAVGFARLTSTSQR